MTWHADLLAQLNALEIDKKVPKKITDNEVTYFKSFPLPVL